MSDSTSLPYSEDSLEYRDLRSILHPATNLATLPVEGPTVRARAQGVHVWDSQGKQYLEAMAGLWCTALGYGVEELAKTAHKQIETLSYSPLFAGISNEPSIILAEKLLSMTPIKNGKVFFGLSGSDANDTQIKLIWLYHNLIGKPEKKKIISRWGGYHGSTVAAGSLTGLPPFHYQFDLPIPGILHTTNPNFYRSGQEGEDEETFSTRLAHELEELILFEGPETIAAFIAEPVMGAGGVIVPPAGYFEKVQQILDYYDIMFIDDEVICGFGRTGQPFGFETFDLKPTTISLAKALTSAYLPLSAVLVPDSIYDVVADGTRQSGVFGHGFTYTGHPVCTAVALRNIELIEELELYQKIKTKSKLFQERLREFEEYQYVGDVRGVGLIGAIELVQDVATKRSFPKEMGAGQKCLHHCVEQGLIVRALGDVICFCPPLVISDSQIDELFDKFARALRATTDELTQIR
ncbi:MAG: aminotransferase class III-fold pyridoxal phosphate-dependent enzyme [Gammaproteobacteria bacterium]|nr:aminotransferase class III-fold pyridoxal phosphate-dependent enzyme [Gammaproteobacteria bacterium]MYF54093.1 aminotransferase class III-fold pyridoxal phosphate-dependent enzyme [Gammaproteobacteria bacterium]MYK43088.1 aminotransferase class III-fold pyridoxal phosphate-dependent enzyme [Gammaproteobacteria bacterium]